MMDRQNPYRTLLSNTFLISFGTFGSKLLAFFMVRFYTGVLAPSDYGTADLIMQTADLLLPIVSLGIINGVFRFSLGCYESRKSVFSAGVYTITAGTLLLAGIVSLLSTAPVFHGYAGLIACYTLTACYHSLCAQFIRAEGKTALFAGQGMLNTALVIGLNILFLVVFRFGIAGYVLSVALADGLCTVYLVLKERLWTLLIPHPQKGIFQQMLRYSIPLIPTTVFWWITSVSDRYMVTGFLGADANGLYAVAYKIPTILTLISGIFLDAWQFSAISEAEGSREAHVRFYSQIWSSFQTVMFLSGSVVIALCHLEIRLLSAEEYYAAWQYVPVLSVAMIFASFAAFMGSVYVVTKKSSLSFWTAMAGAGVNLLLNLLLIPSVGIQGAAVLYLAKFAIGWSLGMGVSVLLLSHVFEKNIYFMSSLFLGLTVSAIPFIIHKERNSLKGHYQNLIFTLLGAALVISLVVLRANSAGIGAINFQSLSILQYGYLIVSELLAISAMLLPGISGSTLLLILGIYVPAISAVKEILHFHLQYLPGILAIAVGVVFGVVFAAKFIRKALRRFRPQMIYLILGLMLGSLYAILMGPTTINNPQEPVSFATFHLAAFMIGVAILGGLEWIKQVTAKRTYPKQYGN